MYQKTAGWTLLVLISSSCIVNTIAFPKQMDSGFVPARGPQLPSQRIERKYAEKPNAIKKVVLDDLDDIQTNQISDSSSGFSWSNFLGMIMQMIFNPGTQQGPNKSDSLDDNVPSTSPWANLLSVGLKIITTALLGVGGGGGDGIDKVDNGSPMQGILAAILAAVVGGRDPEQVNLMAKQAGEFINIVVNLLDALKTSFSHRSLSARNLGRKDSISDASVAGLTMMKAYFRSMSTADDKCLQKYMCEANHECTSDVGSSSLFCQLGTYATSFIIERQTGSNNFELLYEAGRRGRSGDNCHQSYLECNTV